MPSNNFAKVVIDIVETLGLKNSQHGKNKKRTGWNFFDCSRRDWKEVQHLSEDAKRIGLRLDYNSDSKMINLFTPSVKDHKADMLEVQSNVSGMVNQEDDDKWYLDFIE